jgi:heme/copper-type cytochrome/quinol oxidase subunit 2
MKALPSIILGLVLLAVMEGIVWFVLRSSSETPSDEPVVEEVTPVTKPSATPATQKETKASESGTFPEPSVEVVNGITERTIHVGVRQWEWDPKVIRAKEGERVRLIIHNADVRHTLVVPDLQIDIDIPPDGAVADFMATKKGTFDFICGTYCGVGHAEMQGTLVIE